MVKELFIFFKYFLFSGFFLFLNDEVLCGYKNKKLKFDKVIK